MRADNQRELLDLIRRFDSVLNIFGDDEREMVDSEVQALIDERQEARRRREFAQGESSPFRMGADGALYQMLTGPAGLRIVRYEIGGAR